MVGGSRKLKLLLKPVLPGAKAAEFMHETSVDMRGRSKLVISRSKFTKVYFVLGIA